MRTIRWAVAAFGVGCAALAAQQPEGADAPFAGQPGQRLRGPLPALIVAGPKYVRPESGNVTPADENLLDRGRIGRVHDPVTRNGLNPSVLVLTAKVPAADSPVVKLLGQLQKSVEKHRELRFGTAAVFLALPFEVNRDEPLKDNPFVAEVAAAEAVGKALDKDSVLVGLAEPKTGEPFGFDAKTSTLVLFYRRLSVVKSWRATDDAPFTDEQAKDVLGTIDATLAPKRR